MIRIRVKVANKIKLNGLKHSAMSVPGLTPLFTERDLQLFFDLDKVSAEELPSSEFSRQCSLKLPKGNSLSAGERLTFFVSE